MNAETSNDGRQGYWREANSAGNAIVAIVVADIVSYNWYCGSTLLLYTPIHQGRRRIKLWQSAIVKYLI